MSERICSIPDCERPQLKRGLCRAHYLRWWRYGDPLKGRGTVVPTLVEYSCSVDGCDRPQDSRKLCRAHYQRSLKYGDAGSPEVEIKRKNATCSVAGCVRRYYAKGYCNMHWQRWLKFGDPSIVLLHSKGDDVGYGAVHERLKRTVGPASRFKCSVCGATAIDWSYDGADPNEKVGLKRDGDNSYLLAYSTDPTHYVPLCRRCHSRFDHNYPNTPGAVSLKPNIK